MPNLRKLMKEKHWYPTLDETLKPVTDKTARARPAQGWMQQGRVLLPSNQPWVSTFTNELLRFPGGAHDDQVDALAWLIRMVAEKSPPRRTRAGKKPASWRDKLKATRKSENHLTA
jgi:predicted phage terminase large subunit-like protein